ncbi:MAG: TRAP transporter large permease [Desulfofustis sp. PB-SRB1]|jgi:tripartite ATP-independent transporter DctM subunit|nr:TRAP transporter large permease [Desulfofustis sp. PB-SRB1]MBM1003842.1 TRAP transporter large permease [Desulfofustis sp. PB-SRB1]HBH28129.1 TRAP transporter large permease [Desulfofustis sp.]HBH30743.1 TRAP transporter large permease [Desulfofustis sp.]
MLTFPVIIVMALYFTSIPIAFALLAAGLSYFTFADVGTPPDLILQKFITSAASFPLLAIPFFIMAGEIMNYSGISASLMKMADVLTGHLRGGLAQVNVLLSTLMGGISGSANADAAMQSKILVPQMTKRGYSAPFATAITAASSAIAPVIPPGINLIIYALIAQVSVAKMFIGGYTPGILMCVGLMLTVHLIARRRGYQPTREKKATPKEILKQLKESIWGLLLPLGIIFGIRFGIFTPTEAGAMAVLFCIVIGVFLYKELKWAHVPIILKNTVLSTSAVMLIIIAASVFGQYMSWERIPHQLTTSILAISDSAWVILIVINILLLVLGMFLEGGALLIIVAPLLVPLVKTMNIDLIHFGLIMIVNIMIGGITPPFGSMMFTTCAITGATVGQFVREIWPFILALLLVLGVVTYMPAVVMFLPNIL